MKTKTQSRLLLAGISFLLLATLALLVLSTGALAASNIHGTVTDAETDDPIADADVTVYDPEDRENYHETTTDTEGYYEVEVNPGHYNIDISKDGYEDHEGEENVGIEEQVEHNAELESKVETYLEGHVTDAETGDPIEDADVTIDDGTRPISGTTDSDGYYKISCEEGDFHITITHGDYETHEGDVTVEEGPNQYDAQLEPDGGGGGEDTYLEGHVTDADTGDPIEGAKVKITVDSGEFTGTTTDSDGYYKISCDEAEYEIEITHDDHETHEGTVTVEAGANTYDAALTPVSGGGNGEDDDDGDSPAFSFIPVIAALGLVTLSLARRQRS